MDCDHTTTFIGKNLLILSQLLIRYLLFKALIIFQWVENEPLSVGDYDYPVWSDIFGNITSAASILGAIIWAVYMIIDALFINKRVVIILMFTN